MSGSLASTDYDFSCPNRHKVLCSRFNVDGEIEKKHDTYFFSIIKYNFLKMKIKGKNSFKIY